MANIARRDDARWRARHRDDAGKEHARHFERKLDAQRWLNGVTAAQVRGDYVNPKTARDHGRRMVSHLAGLHRPLSRSIDRASSPESCGLFAD